MEKQGGGCDRKRRKKIKDRRWGKRTAAIIVEKQCAAVNRERISLIFFLGGVSWCVFGGTKVGGVLFDKGLLSELNTPSGHRMFV